MKKYDYNAVVIGGGTAGLITANVLAQSKAKVALVERGDMGGDCLNTGCVPSKTLISSAKVMKLMKRSEKFGIKLDSEPILDFPKAMEQIQDVIDYIAPIDSRERYTELGCECFKETATITSPHKVLIGDKEVTTANIVIATGASPFIPPIPGLHDLDYLDSDSLWEIRELPKRLLVVGSGPIGCELSQAFARLGSQVTIISLDPHLLMREDKDVVEYIEKSFDGDNINVIGNASIKEFKSSENSSIVEYEVDGKVSSLEFDKVLVAAGRRANTSNIGLEKIGVELNPNKTIKVDKYLRSNVSNVWACGDVAGPFQFTHMASHQAGYVAMNIMTSPFKKFAVDYSHVPWVTYTDPEIARAGYNEMELAEKSIDAEITTFNFSHQDRAITERENRGLVKVVTQKKSDKILGVTIVGPHAGELLAEFNLAMKNGLGLKAILATIHPYPTFSEANRSVASEFRKKSIPHNLLKYAKKYFAWKRG